MKKRKALYGLIFVAACLCAEPVFSATVAYRQGDGKGAVSETFGTYLQNGSGNYGAAQVLETGGGSFFMLIRFPNIFGDGENQIPVGSTVHSANLSLWTQYVSNGATKTHTVHRVLVDWQETVTWADFGYGGMPGVQYEAAAFTSFTVYGGAPVEYVVNVTSVLNGYSQELYDNLGWYFIDTNYLWYAWWHSDDAASFQYRPLLTVDYTPPSPPEPPAPAVPEPLSVVLVAGGCVAALHRLFRKGQ